MSQQKLTAKQEAFINAYLETGNASEAYRLAYNAENMKPEAIHVNASKLLKDAKVALRVQSMKQAVAEKAILTAYDILNELDQARILAMKLDQPSAMVAASMGRAKVAGLVIDRSELGKPGEFAAMDDAALDASIAELAQDIIPEPKQQKRSGDKARH